MFWKIIKWLKREPIIKTKYVGTTIHCCMKNCIENENGQCGIDNIYLRPVNFSVFEEQQLGKIVSQNIAIGDNKLHITERPMYLPSARYDVDVQLFECDEYCKHDPELLGDTNKIINGINPDAKIKL